MKQSKKDYTEKYEHIVNVDEHPVNQVLKIAKKTICGLKNRHFWVSKPGSFAFAKPPKLSQKRTSLAFLKNFV